MFESPAGWCLGIVLGLIIDGAGYLPAGRDRPRVLARFQQRWLLGQQSQWLTACNNLSSFRDAVWR